MENRRKSKGRWLWILGFWSLGRMDGIGLREAGQSDLAKSHRPTWVRSPTSMVPRGDKGHKKPQPARSRSRRKVRPEPAGPGRSKTVAHFADAAPLLRV